MGFFSGLFKDVMDEPQYALFLKAMEALQSKGFGVRYQKDGSKKSFHFASIDLDDQFFATIWVYLATSERTRIGTGQWENNIKEYEYQLGSLLYRLEKSNPEIYKKYENFDTEMFAYFEGYVLVVPQYTLDTDNLDYIISNWMKVRKIVSGVMG
ncbi:MAG: hypothetical protein LBI27_09625 [Clostridiales bacterium]|jgi:hypothetical protein|nr:hypothetical protein [Clostridiales bacterium]